MEHTLITGKKLYQIPEEAVNDVLKYTVILNNKDSFKKNKERIVINLDKEDSISKYKALMYIVTTIIGGLYKANINNEILSQMQGEIKIFDALANNYKRNGNYKRANLSLEEALKIVDGYYNQYKNKAQKVR